MFYDLASKALFRSAMADFPYEDAIMNQKKQVANDGLTSSESLNEILNQLIEKGSLQFVLNELRLGDFDAKQKLAVQDMETEIRAMGIDMADVPGVPKSYSAAMKTPFSKEWCEAMGVEMEMMQDMGVWQVVDRTIGVEPLGVR